MLCARLDIGLVTKRHSDQIRTRPEDSLEDSFLLEVVTGTHNFCTAHKHNNNNNESSSGYQNNHQTISSILLAFVCPGRLERLNHKTTTLDCAGS